VNGNVQSAEQKGKSQYGLNAPPAMTRVGGGTIKIKMKRRRTKRKKISL
jgi:hypothetical protein